MKKVSAMAIIEGDFIKLIRSAVSNNVSDIHIRSFEKPCFRLRGDLIPVKVQEYSYEDVK